jgi:hypothetical protein
MIHVLIYVIWQQSITSGMMEKIYGLVFSFYRYILVICDVNRSNNVTLTLGWNIISNAGRLPHVRSDESTSFIFPDQYITSRSGSPKSSGQE